MSIYSIWIQRYTPLKIVMFSLVLRQSGPKTFQQNGFASKLDEKNTMTTPLPPEINVIGCTTPGAFILANIDLRGEGGSCVKVKFLEKCEMLKGFWAGLSDMLISSLNSPYVHRQHIWSYHISTESLRLVLQVFTP